MVLEIVKKELKRVFTDKRLILSSFIIPAISIYVIYSLMGSMLGNMITDIEEHESIVYVKDAPESFIAFYDANKDNFNMALTFDGFNREAIITELQNKDADLLIEFDASFDQKVMDYETEGVLPEVKTFYNPAEEYSSEARNTFRYTVLSMYQQVLLQDRFENLNYLSAFGIDTTNTKSAVVSEDKANASILSLMLPMLIAIMLFAGPMGIGMDTIAGEKERGTMATLLLTPAKREHIALGKVLGLGIISIISSLCYFVAIALSLPKMAGGMTGSGGDANVSLNALGFGLEQYLMLIVIMITLVGIYVG
ncbi:MAG: ABC transporter permease subunit, partial [Vallitaleaceae bacterium]|nr:ABC transporter permease subunit [Vallitaleaceae bacterium]